MNISSKNDKKWFSNPLYRNTKKFYKKSTSPQVAG